MKEWIYYYAPSTLKEILVSVYGYKLYRRRYGNNYYRNALDDIIDRRSWSFERIQEYQDIKIRQLIKIASDHVPYYRELFNRLKINQDDIQGKKDLIELLPILDKTTIRNAPDLLVDERLRKERLLKYYTSGTTGTPLKIYRSREAEGVAYAYYEARWRLPYHISKDSSWAMLGGKLIIPQAQMRPPFWVWNSGLKQLYMSSYHLSKEFASSYLDELTKRKLDYIHGYASSLYSLALFAEELGVSDLTFKIAISNAEPLYNYQKRQIEKMFHCRVIDTYGSTEWCFQGSECSGKKLHVSPDVGLFEIVDPSGKSLPEGQAGEVVCTGLINFAQPLIRYRVGDTAVLSKEQCNCGLNFPVLESVVGRTDDLIVLKDGRRVGRLDPLFKGEMHIAEAQVIQEALDRLLIKVVPLNTWGKSAENLLRRQFANYLGSIKLDIEIVNRIPRTASGKFKAVVSRIHSMD
jgi:phenylacetate-CoA ligase